MTIVTNFLIRKCMTFAQDLRRTYWKIAKPNVSGVHAIVLTPSGFIVLVEQTYATGLFLPGGELRRHEDPAAGMLRELREEIGLSHWSEFYTLRRFFSSNQSRRVDTSIFVVRDAVFRRTRSWEVQGLYQRELAEVVKEQTFAAEQVAFYLDVGVDSKEIGIGTQR